MSIRPIDLRDILDYVPRFRNHVFVLSIDGSVVADPNFDSIITDIAVLHSLNIKIILCYGIGLQIRSLSASQHVPISDDRGEGPTDEATLGLAIQANSEVLSVIMRALAVQELPYTLSNALSARITGVVNGVDQQLTGVCDQVEKARITRQLDEHEIPVFAPISYDEKGRAIRLNSDQVAATLAHEMSASKLVYLTTRPRLQIADQPILNCSAEELSKLLRNHPDSIDPLLLSKAKHAIKVLAGNTERVHILDGRVDGCLLIEVFDKVGLGSMIHSNEYDRIRKANPDDLADIYTLVKQASRTQHLINRSLEEITQNLDQFYVYEVDESIIGCTCLIPYPDEQSAELASVCVQPYHQGKGIGKKLSQYSLEQARELGFKTVFALSTQTSEFFTEHLGFELSDLDALPEARRIKCAENHRNSIVLVKQIN